MTELLVGGGRLAGLSLRMALALFMARFLSFTDIGLFSLLVGITALLPGTMGLGLSYFVNREIVGKSSGEARHIARDRLIITILCAAMAAAVLCVVVAAGGLSLPVNLFLFSAIMLNELVGFDLNLLMIARGRLVGASALLFIRSAAWIPFYLLFAYFDSSFRNIDKLIMFWFVGSFCYILAACYLLRHIVKSRDIFKKKFNLRWLYQYYPRSIKIWISDSSFAISQVADRFIISFLIGVSFAGIYYFYFAIANAAFQVVQSATTQAYMPQMRVAFVNEPRSQFIRYVNLRLRKMVFLSIIAFISTGAGSYLIVIFLKRRELLEYSHIIPVIMLTMILKSFNEFMGIIDYMMERDIQFFSFNIASLIVTLFMLVVFSILYGIVGSVFALMFSTLLFAGIRWVIWLRLSRTSPALRDNTAASDA